MLCFIHSVDKPEDVTLGHSISDGSERARWRGEGLEAGKDIYEFLQQKARSSGHPKITVNKIEKQASQVNEIEHFSVYGKVESLGSLKSFLWCEPRLPGARILCFLILSLLGCTVRVPTMVDSRWWASFASILCSLRAYHPGGCNVVTWWLQRPS